MWVVALGVAVVQEVVVDQVPTPALQEWVVSIYHFFCLWSEVNPKALLNNKLWNPEMIRNGFQNIFIESFFLQFDSNSRSVDYLVI